MPQVGAPETVRGLVGLFVEIVSHILRSKDRAILRDGAYADSVVLDPDGFSGRAMHEQPRRNPAGVVYTIVNGEIIWRDDRLGQYVPSCRAYSKKNLYVS